MYDGLIFSLKIVKSIPDIGIITIVVHGQLYELSITTVVCFTVACK
jgi:hypothetical protein